LKKNQDQKKIEVFIETVPMSTTSTLESNTKSSLTSYRYPIKELLKFKNFCKEDVIELNSFPEIHKEFHPKKTRPTTTATTSNATSYWETKIKLPQNLEQKKNKKEKTDEEKKTTTEQKKPTTTTIQPLNEREEKEHVELPIAPGEIDITQNSETPSAETASTIILNPTTTTTSTIKPKETNTSRLQQRQKQIDIGKNTLGWHCFIKSSYKQKKG